MFGLGAPELLIVAVVIVLLFGSTKLPKLARSLGEAKKEIQVATAELHADHSRANHPSIDLTSTPAPADTITLRVHDLEALLASREDRIRAEQHPFSAA